MNIQKLTLLFFIGIFLFSCWKDSKPEDTHMSTSQSGTEMIQDSQYFSDIIFSEKSQDIQENFAHLASSKDLNELQKSLQTSDFLWTQKVIEKITSQINKETLTSEDKQKVKSLVNVYISAMLNEWNYLYKPEEKSKQASDYIKNEILSDPDFVDPFYNNYHLWYAQEIIKNYDEALQYYQKALQYAWESEKNKRLKSIIYNQIGHVYDLSWDIEQAYSYYVNAFKADKKNLFSALNIGRYLATTWDFLWAKEYFEYASHIEWKAEKAEAYFNLSSVELRIGSEKSNIEKSIEYAKKSIESYKDYPMGYIWLARGYYMLNDTKYNTQIETNLEKAIELNPNTYLWYRYLWMYHLDNNDMEKFSEYIDKSSQAVEKDPILMEHNKEYVLLQNDMLKIFFQVDLSEYKELYEWDDYFKAIIQDQMERQNFGLYKKFKSDIQFLRFYNEIKK